VRLYRQLIDQVRRLVASGQPAPGTELPSVREVVPSRRLAWRILEFI
jgi:GntR family transcriptional regulator